jgi:DNA-directed RNA polymerase specialized sigma24 family protein
MYRYLVDYARKKKRRKRGGGWRRVALEDAFRLSGDRPLDLLSLHDVLEKLRALDPQQASIIEYRIFGALSNRQVAHILEVPTGTVERMCRSGLAWLRRELSRGGSE